MFFFFNLKLEKSNSAIENSKANKFYEMKSIKKDLLSVQNYIDQSRFLSSKKKEDSKSKIDNDEIMNILESKSIYQNFAKSLNLKNRGPFFF